MGHKLAEAFDRNRRVQDELARLLRAVTDALPVREDAAAGG
jgi:hypothetical protein